MIGYASRSTAVSFPDGEHLTQQRTWTLKQLFRKIPLVKVYGDRAAAVSSLVTDSKRVRPGSLFFAVKGRSTDGHFFIKEAIDRGAVGIVVDRPSKEFRQVAVFQVEDVQQVLADVARRFYEAPDEALHLLKVTGTSGKTTVTTWVKYLLDSLNCPTGLIGSVCYDLGKRQLPATKSTPDLVTTYDLLDQMRTAGCKVAAMEASSHGLDQRRLLGLKTKVAVFLNLTPEHMDYHTDMEEYYQAKAKLFTGENAPLPECAVINIDDLSGQRLKREIDQVVPCLTFGLHPDAALRADNIRLEASQTFFDLSYSGKTYSVKTALIGAFNISNALAALAVLKSLGYELEALLPLLETFPGARGRLERVEAGQSFSVFVDYAHKQDALKNVLETLRQVSAGRLLVVFGCGGNRDKTKRPRMTAVVERLADQAWATADNPRKENLESIFSDMKQGISTPSKITFTPDRQEAIRLALENAQVGDCVLIAGKGHETFQEFAHGVVPFSDRKVAEALLKEQEIVL